MLRLLILFLILRGAAATSEDLEGTSSGDIGDDEDGDDYVKVRRPVFSDAGPPGTKPGSDKSTGDDEANEGGTLVIIIAAVSVIVLAIGGIVAILLFRRYLQNREQGVYSVPAEQGQKAAV
ncbi:uncharacterized protein si:dkey-262k9.2 [Puntigrus tetrazona]|uniref:uncharacterized protein si:dkey-262k9.2 n=1 Tax=Puntigrus tetrazona TaxID=1606681 RepID=UPI001C8924C5|nr:uncharacterized protein si:dkey-262k9.2 [Puntigrus tetrazona]XP_043114063.1 uncharacterized protein si:dkey-262k9.2 [Puntigrus tetrazona]XP_043114064.1 uncharacterized protein si:dkey-262k9.2 [Puntigrus tetrazona]XP_043114065.1 uncharacterized protein si:dkey-262k9.2 [Puntigrus tetrazona]